LFCVQTLDASQQADRSHDEIYVGEVSRASERTRWPRRCFVVITIRRRPGTAQGLAEKGRIQYGIVRMSHGPLNVYLNIADYIYNYNYKYTTGVSYRNKK
jgi:hypothetical protein